MSNNIVLTERELEQICQRAARATLQEQQDALSSKEGFIRWLKGCGMNSIANKIIDWGISKLKKLWNDMFG